MADDDKDKDPTAAFQNRLNKMNGDAMAFATQLFDENYQHRSEIRDLKKKVPGEGSVVLSKEEAASYEAFKALNLKPEEVKTKLESVSTLEGENATLKRKDTLRDVAGAAGFKLSVLEDRDRSIEGLEYILKDEKDKQGNARKVAYVKHEGKEVPIEQFASEKWADYLPALQGGQATTPIKPGNGGDPPPAGGSNLFDRIRNKVKEGEEKSRTGGPTTLAGVFGRSTAAQ